MALSNSDMLSYLYFFSICTILIGQELPVSSHEPIRIEGLTMGTSYHITYFDKQRRDFKFSIDSLLALVNKSINTYDPTSEVSIFNRSEKGVAFKLPYFYAPLQKANDIAISSGGAFDPTVMPLVNAWGFGPAKELIPTMAQVDSIKAFVGIQKIILTSDSVRKTDPRVQLDFGGIGQGYGADVVAEYLKSKSIDNFLVEIGGEGVAIGKNLYKRKAWRIGILDPNSTPENQFFKAYVEIKDKAFTTSGNYFNYREINGKKYGHTIDPKTGYPVQHELLSASVFAQDCATADAWDTAFMVIGFEKTVELLKSHSHLDAFLIFSTPEGNIGTYVTPGIKSQISIEQ